MLRMSRCAKTVFLIVFMSFKEENNISTVATGRLCARENIILCARKLSNSRSKHWHEQVHTNFAAPSYTLSSIHICATSCICVRTIPYIIHCLHMYCRSYMCTYHPLHYSLSIHVLQVVYVPIPPLTLFPIYTCTAGRIRVRIPLTLFIIYACTAGFIYVREPIDYSLSIHLLQVAFMYVPYTQWLQFGISQTGPRVPRCL